MDFIVENPMFQLGQRQVAPRVSRRNPVRRPIPARRATSASSSNTFGSDVTPIQFTNPPRWLLLPVDQIPPEIAQAFQFIPYGYKPAFEIWAESGTSPFRITKFRAPKGVRRIPFFTKEFSDAMYDTLLKNQRLRWVFKRLIQRWRVNRLKQVNTIDIVTFEEPKTPIYVYDWPNRSKYVFEASTLFRSIRSRILHSEELIANSQRPNNPYTNKPLSYGQLHFAFDALRASGITDWTFEALRACEYDLGVFKRRNSTQLRVAALKRVFANPTDEDYCEILFDFIDLCHDDAEIMMERRDVWDWCIRNCHDAAPIQVFRGYCYRYYYSLITLSNKEEFDTIREEIMKKIAPSIGTYLIKLILLWNARSKNGAPK